MKREIEVDLFSRYQNGDGSFEEIYLAYYRAIRFYISRNLSEEYREDCFQDCCIALPKIANDFQLQRNLKFTTFLLSRLRGIVTDYRRNMQYDMNRHVNLDALLEAGEAHDFAGSSSRDINRLTRILEEKVSVYSDIELIEFREQFRIAIASLTEKEKDFIILRFFEEYKVKEIAIKLSIPVGSIHAFEMKLLSKIKLALSLDLKSLLSGI